MEKLEHPEVVSLEHYDLPTLNRQQRKFVAASLELADGRLPEAHKAMFSPDAQVEQSKHEQYVTALLKGKISEKTNEKIVGMIRPDKPSENISEPASKAIIQYFAGGSVEKFMVKFPNAYAFLSFKGSLPEISNSPTAKKEFMILLYGKKQAEYAEQVISLEQQERIPILKTLIKNGIDLIKAGKAHEAATALGTHYHLRRLNLCQPHGEMTTIHYLRNENELDAALYAAGRHARVGELPSFTILDTDGNQVWEKTFEDFPDRYHPELVKKFRAEVAIIHAEEWLHMLQEELGKPLAGQENVETDVAAFLDAQGIYLSPHFISRYSERQEWFRAHYPERTQ